MIDLYPAAAIILLILGVIGSVAPMMPGALFSIAGVLLYWWSTGYSSPGAFFMAFALSFGLLTLLVDYFAGAISAKAGGASNITTAASAVVGLLLFFVAGPFGVILGVAGTVFVMEYFRTRDMNAGATASLYSTLGLLASTAVQALLTASILVAFLLAVML